MKWETCGTSLLEPNVRGTPEFSCILEYHEGNLVNIIPPRFKLEAGESWITKNDVATFSVTEGRYCV